MPDPSLPAATARRLDVRHLFDLPADVSYLNCAFMGPLPKVAIEAGWNGLARKARPWTIPPDDFTVPVDQLRSRFAELLGAPDDGDGVAITPSVSYGVATAANGIALDRGQVAVVLQQQFPSDVYGWEALARRHGGALHVVPAPSDGDWTAALLGALAELGDRVGLVAAPPCHWIDGGAIDLVAVGLATRSVGAALSVDVCQTLGALPFDVGAVQPDFVVGATYKWLLGPYSLGFLWAAPDRRRGEPIEHGWTGRANSHCLAYYTDQYQPGARRYDVGEVANFALVPTALAAASMVASWGPAAVAAHAGAITAVIADGAAELGLEVAAPAFRSPHLIGLRLGGVLERSGIDPEALAPALADRGVHVSVRGDALRVSVHAFNGMDDADRLLGALAEVLR